jgi:hypothetical protein
MYKVERGGPRVSDFLKVPLVTFGDEDFGSRPWREFASIRTKHLEKPERFARIRPFVPERFRVVVLEI